MTTNHVDRLDAGLIRPGRVDMNLELGLTTHDINAQLFFNIFRSNVSNKAKFKKLEAEERQSSRSWRQTLQARCRSMHSVPSFLRSNAIDSFRSADRDTFPSGFSFVEEVVASCPAVTIPCCRECVALTESISLRSTTQRAGSLANNPRSESLSTLEILRI
jgi:hypothetical protein